MALLSRILEQCFRLSCVEYQVVIYCQSALYTVILFAFLSSYVTLKLANKMQPVNINPCLD